MRLLVALGGNALLQRGEPLTAENQRRNIRVAAEALVPLVPGNELVVSHGNGPQVGLLALQAASYAGVAPYPLDVLGAETEGMIGYVIEQELASLLPDEIPCATVLTMVEVDGNDPSLTRPTKPIGPVYDEAQAVSLERSRGWTMARDGDGWRRVVPSPAPKCVFELRPIRWLLEKGVVVICAGGGGIPTAVGADGTLSGVEAVIDKDRASALLAWQLDADLLVLATDVDGVYRDWGTDRAALIESATPDQLRAGEYAQGSMGPKVGAACAFVEATGKPAVIGALTRLAELVAGSAGTRVVPATGRERSERP